MEQRTNKSTMYFGTRRRFPAINNPYVKWRTIPITIKRFFTDVDGLVLDKTDVQIPDALKTKYPFFVFGDFDRKGGYNTGLKAVNPMPGTFYLTTFVNGDGMTSQQITGFTGFNNVRNSIGQGDIVSVYTDNLNAPSIFVWIVVSNKYGSISSITDNSQTTQKDGLIGKIFLDHFKYFTDNPNAQWAEPMHFTRSTNVATWGDDQVMPYIFKNPYTEQEGFIQVDCSFNLDQYLSVGSYYHYDTELLNWNFKLGTM